MSQKIEYKEKVLDELVELVVENLTQVCVKNDIIPPRIFYVGMGKTGSSSLKKGFDESVAHWHGENYFQEIYNTRLLEEYDLCLYDLILHFGKRFEFKPLIIESIREPIIRAVSTIGQLIFLGRSRVNSVRDYIELLHPEDVVQPASLKWKDYFGVDLAHQTREQT